jgi:hypothetical protein
MWSCQDTVGFVAEGPLPDLSHFYERTCQHLTLPRMTPRRDGLPQGWGRCWIPFDGPHVAILEMTLQLREARSGLQILVTLLSCMPPPCWWHNTRGGLP